MYKEIINQKLKEYVLKNFFLCRRCNKVYHRDGELQVYDHEGRMRELLEQNETEKRYCKKCNAKMKDEFNRCKK